MIVKAQQKYIRTSPRKMRLVVGAIRGLPPREALAQLAFMRKRAAQPVAKVIKQALANAANNHGLQQESLNFKNIEVSEGPVFKRWRAVSRGRAHPILKRTSHLTIVLESQQEAGGKKLKTQQEKPAKTRTQKKDSSKKRPAKAKPKTEKKPKISKKLKTKKQK